METLKTLIALALMIAASLMLMAKPAHAYLVHEIEPGIVEIRGAQEGTLIVQSLHIDKKTKLVYIAVKETGPTSRGENIKYFYAPLKEFSLKKLQKFHFIQYGLAGRVQNQKRIPFGTQRYFYPLVYFQTVS